MNSPAPRRKPAPSRRREYLTPTQVADRLLVAPVTVRLWASRGLLPSVSTPGGHRRFRAQDVEDFLVRQRQVQVSPPATPSRVLIIDDDAQYARYLANLLTARAPQVHVEMALDGFSAGIKCEALRPDVVTLDLHMPDMDGIEVCRLLRGMFAAERCRIVALSGHLTPENTKQILAAGADACVAKNTSAQGLLRSLGLADQRPSG